MSEENDASISRKPRLGWKSLAGLTVAIVIGAGAAAAWFVYFSHRPQEPLYHPPAPDAQAEGCVASVRIKDIDILGVSNVGLTSDGRTLLVVGVDETKKWVAARIRVEGREEWRTSLDDLVGFARISVSPSGGKAAVWGNGVRTPVYILDAAGALRSSSCQPDRLSLRISMSRFRRMRPPL